MSCATAKKEGSSRYANSIRARSTRLAGSVRERAIAPNSTKSFSPIANSIACRHAVMSLTLSANQSRKPRTHVGKCESSTYDGFHGIDVLEHVKRQVSLKTHERYEQVCRKNIVPLLGAVLLSKLKPVQVSEAYTKALVSGRRNGKGGLSARTVHHMHVILKGALTQAVKWELLIRNPADAVDPPQVGPNMQVYDLAQTAELIEAVRGNRAFVP